MSERSELETKASTSSRHSPSPLTPIQLIRHLSMKLYISILSHPVRLSYSLSLPLHCEPKYSPPSHYDNDSIKGFFTSLETMTTPCVNKLANDQLDLGLRSVGGTALPCSSLLPPPRTLVPRPITPNHDEQYSEG
ncbi:hypothetical protein Q8A73_023153 [Channa argus]|nr:hypothetical protein Q8A73_023153 [Channa argus]